MKKTFADALRGILSAIKGERNMRVHITAAAYVILFGLIVKLSCTEWICAIFCIGLVIGAEMINTAVERLCDALHPEFSEKIGKVKDVAAGAVLVFAFAAAAVGCGIFFCRESRMNMLIFAQNHIVLSILIVLSIPITFYFAQRRKK